jgi:Flp pilus assembly protein TadG
MTAPGGAAKRNERGAVMVEFAIVMPLLLLLVFGIIEFGRGYNVKVQLTGSVREAARELALGGSNAEARQAVRDAAPGVSPAVADSDIAITRCPADGSDGNAVVTVTYDLDALTPLVPDGELRLTARGVMRCGL